MGLRRTFAGGSPRAVAPRRTAQARRSARVGAALVTPACALVLAFVLFPLGYAIYISLTDWPLIGAIHYIGLANYKELFNDPQFLHAVKFTLLYTAIVTPPIFLVGYGLAALLRANRFGAKVFRTLFFMPFVVGLTTISFIYTIELQPESGGVDFLLSKLGIVSQAHAWTVTYASALIIISVIVVWFASGLTMLILTGGMQSIPRELYEAADVDGASWWDKEWRITLPMLRRSIALSLIISVIGSLLAFNQFFIIAQNNSGIESVVESIYTTGFENNRLGYATAMAMVLMVVIALVTIVQFFALRDTTEL
ncbi:MAG: carbohydrate ABC transporter permease [Solirubrobacteraceae bacterium]